MKNKKIPFAPPDITVKEINEVVKVLKSGWITTGPKTAEFESEIEKYCNTDKAICLNSATAGIDMILSFFNIEEGDEVITTPYTFPSAANAVLHKGAKVVFADLKKDEFNIDPDKIEKVISKKTKAVISVDIAGWPVDYNEINEILIKNKNKYHPEKNTLQEKLDKPLFISDSAHSFGAKYYKKHIGSNADFSIFSFHATKNLTSAEGGAITFNTKPEINAVFIYNQLKQLSLHGQSKDAYSKLKIGNWKYTIENAGYKCNMPDILSAVGLIQLKRYEKEILPKRKKLYYFYEKQFRDDDRFIIPPFNAQNKESSYHLFPLRINGYNENDRDRLISKIAEKGISSNVHFIPIVMQPFYKNLGYDIKDFPVAFNMYRNEISLPFYTNMKLEDAEYVADVIKQNI
jgi:dTDP-4-amino-4,6-dideoxygalactose transaminase